MKAIKDIKEVFINKSYGGYYYWVNYDNLGLESDWINGEHKNTKQEAKSDFECFAKLNGIENYFIKE